MSEITEKINKRKPIGVTEEIFGLNPRILYMKHPNKIWARKNCGKKPCGG